MSAAGVHRRADAGEQWGSGCPEATAGAGQQWEGGFVCTGSLRSERCAGVEIGGRSEVRGCWCVCVCGGGEGSISKKRLLHHKYSSPKQYL